MGVLFDLSQRLITEIETRNPNPLDAIRAKGEAARAAGFMVSMVSSGDPDDPSKIAGLREAARSLGISL